MNRRCQWERRKWERTETADGSMARVDATGRRSGLHQSSMAEGRRRSRPMTGSEVARRMNAGQAVGTFREYSDRMEHPRMESTAAKADRTVDRAG